MLSVLRNKWNLISKVEYREIRRVKKIPRYIPFETKLFGKEIYAIDSASFLVMQNEIFNKEIYKFRSDNSHPRIIDVGANIGLSTIYFKLHYPNAKITAFEPDPLAYEALEKNVITNHRFSDIELINKAVWNEDTEIEFTTNKADGGSLSVNKPGFNKIKIETLRFRNFLLQQKNIEFLKIDIEGAESEVIPDCYDCLSKVKFLFLEYHSFVNEEQQLSKIIDILKSSGFRIYVQTNFCSTQPFFKIAPSLNQDLQLNIFAIRE